MSSDSTIPSSCACESVSGGTIPSSCALPLLSSCVAPSPAFCFFLFVNLPPFFPLSPVLFPVLFSALFPKLLPVVSSVVFPALFPGVPSILFAGEAETCGLSTESVHTCGNGISKYLQTFSYNENIFFELSVLIYSLNLSFILCDDSSILTSSSDNANTSL